MILALEDINTTSGIDGLMVLQDIAHDKEIFDESPVPEEIDEYLYTGFLKLSEDEKGVCDRYWVKLDKDIIGYSDITYKDEKSEIGIVLTKEYRNKGLGLETMKLLINKAKECNVEKVMIKTNKNNTRMRKLCLKLNTKVVDEKDDYWYEIT